MSRQVFDTGSAPISPDKSRLSAGNHLFETACKLLQSNVIHLCLSLGLKPQELHPQPAIMPNIHLVMNVCLRRAQKLSEYVTSFVLPKENEYCDVDDISNALTLRYRRLQDNSEAEREESEWLVI